MNTSQLRSFITKDPFVRRQFGGVCAADELPLRVPYRPSVYLVNTDKKRQPGRHCVTFYFPRKGPSEFFDSMGRSPEYYNRRFKTVLLKNGSNYVANAIRVQSWETTTCGHFCLFYSAHRCRGWSMRRIVHSFDSKHLRVNERVIKRFVQGL